MYSGGGEAAELTYCKSEQLSLHSFHLLRPQKSWSFNTSTWVWTCRYQINVGTLISLAFLFYNMTHVWGAFGCVLFLREEMPMCAFMTGAASSLSVSLHEECSLFKKKKKPAWALHQGEEKAITTLTFTFGHHMIDKILLPGETHECLSQPTQSSAEHHRLLCCNQIRSDGCN